MSDKLEKCVCGHIVTEYTHHSRRDNDGIIEHDYSIRCLNPKANWCPCETPRYSTIDEATTAWNTMQRALKAGWSSEVPTEEGFYLVYDVKQKYTFEVCLIPQALPTLVVRHCGVYSNILDFCKNNVFFWYLVNHPDPPKE